MLVPSIVYDETTFENYYNELKDYRMEIPKNAETQGFSGLQELFSRVQEYRNRVSEMLATATTMKAKAKVQFDSATYAYEASLDSLLDTDPEVVALPSDKVKVARANKKLTVQIERMQDAKMTLTLIDAYYKTVDHVMGNLESVNKNLTEQCNIIKKLHPSNGPAYPQVATTPGHTVRAEI